MNRETERETEWKERQRQRLNEKRDRNRDRMKRETESETKCTLVTELMGKRFLSSTYEMNASISYHFNP